MTYIKQKRSKSNTGREAVVLDVRPLMHERGIVHIYAFLTKKVGLPANTASALNNGKARNISNCNIEKLCKILFCTPNDLYVVKEELAEQLPEGHPLRSMRKSKEPVFQLQQKLARLSPQQLKKFFEQQQG